MWYYLLIAQVSNYKHTHIYIWMSCSIKLAIRDRQYKYILATCTGSYASLRSSAIAALRFDVPHRTLGDPTNHPSPGVNSALRVTFLHCFLQLVRIAVRRPRQAARTRKLLKVGATTAGWVASGYFASKCIDTLLIAGSAVDIFKERLWIGTGSCWYWICGYQRSGKEGKEGRNIELHL